MREIDEIKNWRDSLGSEGRIFADGKVWSSSLDCWVPITSKQVIAVLDWVLKEGHYNPKQPLEREA